MDQTPACLSDAVMASYIDRRLSLTERHRAEAHLATCDQCLSILANTIKTLNDLNTSGEAHMEVSSEGMRRFRVHLVRTVVQVSCVVVNATTRAAAETQVRAILDSEDGEDGLKLSWKEGDTDYGTEVVDADDIGAAVP